MAIAVPCYLGLALLERRDGAALAALEQHIVAPSLPKHDARHATEADLLKGGQTQTANPDLAESTLYGT